MDACDWAAILMRMYVRWGEAHGFEVVEVERTDEPEAGIRSAMIKAAAPAFSSRSQPSNG